MKQEYPSIQNWLVIVNEERNRHGKCWRGQEFWYEFTLQVAAKGLKSFDLPLAAIDMNIQPWNLTNLGEIAYHVNRVNEVDFNYPIILDDFGCLRDGFHRVVKAMIENKKTIKAVRLKEMPPIDGEDKKE